MKRLRALIILLLFISGCNTQKEISGLLIIPDAIFEYIAEGKGIPCVTFTSSENIGHSLFSDNLRQRFNLIYADASKLKIDKISNITLDMIVDDIEKVRKTIGYDKIAVLGHSMFGCLPFEYALKYPDNCSYSITTGARPFTTEKYSEAVKEHWNSNASDERKAIQKKNIEKLSEMDMTELNQTERFIKSYTARIPTFFYDPHFDMSHVWEGAKINTDFTNHFGGVLMDNFDNTDNYHKIKTPILVIAGRHDYWAPHFLWDDVKSKIPDFSFHLFENAGHNPMLEIPAKFDSVVLEWIKSNR